MTVSYYTLFMSCFLCHFVHFRSLDKQDRLRRWKKNILLLPSFNICNVQKFNKLYIKTLNHFKDYLCPYLIQFDQKYIKLNYSRFYSCFIITTNFKLVKYCKRKIKKKQPLNFCQKRYYWKRSMSSMRYTYNCRNSHYKHLNPENIATFKNER